MGNLNETESIIIGCIIGGSCLIVFGIILWFFCSKKNPKYDEISQNDGNNGTKDDDIENGTKAILETTPLSQPDGQQQIDENDANKLLPTNSKPHVLISVQKSINNDPEHKQPVADYEVKIQNEDDSNVELVRGVLSYNNDQNPSQNDPALKSFTNMTNITTASNTNVTNTNITPNDAEVIEYEEEHEETTQMAGKGDIAVSKAGNKSSTDLNAVVEDKQIKSAESETVTAEETRKEEVQDMEDEEEDEVNVINSGATPAKDTVNDGDTEVIEKKDTLAEDGYDIENEDEDIVRPLEKQALQQNFSMESQASARSAMSASTKAVLAMDSDANVFGNRWGDDAQGFEWNENDSTTMRVNNDGDGGGDKIENDNNNEVNETNEEDINE